jgi:hypothetical protein
MSNFFTAAAFHLVTTTALLLMSCSGAIAQELWRKTEYGMTVEQVRKVIPESASPASSPSYLGTGATELLRIEDYAVGEFEFTVSFYFQEGRLEQVTLGREETSWHSAKMTFDRLTTFLRAKYGTEISSTVSSEGILNMDTKDWLSAGTNIGLLAMAVADNPATLNINYQVRVAKAAEKL